MPRARKQATSDHLQASGVHVALAEGHHAQVAVGGGQLPAPIAQVPGADPDRDRRLRRRQRPLQVETGRVVLSRAVVQGAAEVAANLAALKAEPIIA